MPTSSKVVGKKSKDSPTGNVTGKDASADQKTNTLLLFRAAYASETINAKAGDLIKKCRPILILHGNFINPCLF